MNKFRLYFILLSSALILFSCNKSDDSNTPEVLRDYGTQFAGDNQAIRQYLQTHYIESIVDHVGFADDQDIKISRLRDGDTFESIWDSSLLDSLKVTRNDVPYTIYYIKQRIGSGPKGAPSKVDGVLTQYYGGYFKMVTENDTLADNTIVPNVTKINTVRFDSSQFPENYIDLTQVIPGWPAIMSLFSSGTIVPGDTPPGSPTVFRDFGAGVMFLPSGMGYYNLPTQSTPSYSILMFKFKVYDIKRLDQDGDGILSINEDLPTAEHPNGDGNFSNDDTDGDGIQNFLDDDDDGDGYLTRNEIKKPANFIGGGISPFFPFSPVADNPDTPLVDETELYGVPNCAADLSNPVGDIDNFTNPTRVRKYLDKNCH